MIDPEIVKKIQAQQKLNPRSLEIETPKISETQFLKVSDHDWRRIWTQTFTFITKEVKQAKTSNQDGTQIPAHILDRCVQMLSLSLDIFLSSNPDPKKSVRELLQRSLKLSFNDLSQWTTQNLHLMKKDLDEEYSLDRALQASALESTQSELREVKLALKELQTKSERFELVAREKEKKSNIEKQSLKSSLGALNDRASLLASLLDLPVKAQQSFTQFLQEEFDQPQSSLGALTNSLTNEALSEALNEWSQIFPEESDWDIHLGSVK